MILEINVRTYRAIFIEIFGTPPKQYLNYFEENFSKDVSVMINSTNELSVPLDVYEHFK
jgi:hypothetical protein